MEPAQTAQNENSLLASLDPNVPDPDFKQQLQDAWISFCAVGGLLTKDAPDLDDNGQMTAFKRMTVDDFSKQIGVPRRTLYDWKKSIPDFGNKVSKRREELWPIARETAVFNRLFLIGMSGTGQPSVSALLGLAAHFSKLRLATQPIQHEAGESWAALINNARDKNIIEGETVDT